MRANSEWHCPFKEGSPKEQVPQGPCATTLLERYLRARLWAFVLIYNWPHWVWVERRKNKQRLRSRANINDIARPVSIETNKDSYRELMHNTARTPTLISFCCCSFCWCCCSCCCRSNCRCCCMRAISAWEDLRPSGMMLIDRRPSSSSTQWSCAWEWWPIVDCGGVTS